MRGYRGDESLKNIIFKIYQYIQSMPFPKEWMSQKVEMFNIDENEDFGKTIWGEILLYEIKQNIKEGIEQLNYILSKLRLDIELTKFASIIAEDISMYENLLNASNNWDLLYNNYSKISYSKWPIDKKVVSELKEDAKQIRDNVKKQISEQLDKNLIYSSKEANVDIKDMYTILKELEIIINEFSEKFAMKKKEKNCIDFNDIEHYALKILVKKENDKYIPTEVAKKFKEKFEEIAIDEYQDSNLVQEYILTTISRGNNIFMVGDVKQSIYKFRQARPELFLEKYEKYSLIDNKHENENVKIQLFKNFRSRRNILNFTNLVFNTIMTKKLGDINYDENEYLRQDKDYDEPNSNIKNYAGNIELNIIDLSEKSNEDDETERIENTEIEAKFVAKRIKELLNSNYHIFDKKEKTYRKATYKDIVILLRATYNDSPIYEKAISDLGMPVFSDTSSEYLTSIEIQTVLSVLKILDNPLQDIPLVSVMRSYIGGFTDNELIKIRLFNKNSYFYEALKIAEKEADKELKNKISNFFAFLNKWKNENEYVTLEELIWNIYMDTGYYQYVSLMPDGNLRTANLKMLLERAKQFEEASFKGLFNFLNFIDKLKNSSNDLGSAKIIGENENVIRIMSIHKSKGLEFPIVFLCGTGKKFNMQDLNDKLLLHYDIGFGPKYINTEQGIEYNTLAKEAIKIKATKESIAEEMRILYVALTRSREKLIITGIDKNSEDSIKNKKMLIKMFNGVNEGLIKKNLTYLNWLEIVSIVRNEEIKGILDINIIAKSVAIEKNEIKEDTINELYNLLDRKKYEDENINDLLHWRYSFYEATKIPSKTSVTKIKQLKNEEKNISNSEKYEAPMPLFLKETDELSASQKGSAMHLFLQKINLKKIYNKDEIYEELQKLVANKILTSKEAEAISVDKVDKFLHSKLIEDLRSAKEIYKEQAFYMTLPSAETGFEKTDENILVQGIIDLYYIRQNDEIVLVDYKTDFVKNENELIEKYKNQLDLYRQAIRNAMGKNVKETYIYSTFLDKEIKLT